jgi:peroxiredoxin
VGRRPAHLETGHVSPIWADLGRSKPDRLQLLIFERGHWCGACLRHLAGLDEAAARIAERNVDLVVVTHEMAANTQAHPFRLMVDPALEIGAEFGIVDADETGYITLRPTTLVVDESGRILFSYCGDDSTDRPTVAELELVLDRISPAPDPHS